MMRSKNRGYQAPEDVSPSSLGALIPTVVTEDEPLDYPEEFELFDSTLEDDVFCDEFVEEMIFGQRVADVAPHLDDFVC